MAEKLDSEDNELFIWCGRFGQPIRRNTVLLHLQPSARSGHGRYFSPIMIGRLKICGPEL
jgi:hypothetical protein